MSKIHSALNSLVIPIEDLEYLEGNPRKGDVLAIQSSLEEFGQLKAVVVRVNDDGSKTIIAGNHTVAAARNLGWTEIAAVVDSEMDEATAVAFALVDNRVSELGHNDPELLVDSIIQVSEIYPTILDSVGWDDFEVASMQTDLMQRDFEGSVPTGQAGGYVAPVMIDQGQPSITPVMSDDEEDGPRLVAPSGTDEKSVIVGGVGGSVSQTDSSKKASIQYTLIFDDSDQMARWWEFIRFLRNSNVYDGDTITTRLMDFIEAHGEF